MFKKLAVYFPSMHTQQTTAQLSYAYEWACRTAEHIQGKANVDDNAAAAEK